MQPLVMQRLEGRVFEGFAMPGVAPDQRRAMYDAMADAFAAMASREPPVRRRNATVGPSCVPSMRPARHESPRASASSFLKRMYGPN